MDITPEAFQEWLQQVQARGLAATDAEAGALIGRNKNSVVNIKKRGGDRTVALACAAVLAGLKPYGE